MKTTVVISDSLFARAKRLSERTGRPLRALVEEGLRRVLDEEKALPPFELPDLSIGDAAHPNPLEELSWAELRGEIYGDRGA